MSRMKKYVIAFGIIIVLLIIISLVMGNEYKAKATSEIYGPKNFIFNAINDLNTQSSWNSKATFDNSFLMQCQGSTKGAGVSCNFKSNVYGDGMIRINSSNHDSILISEITANSKDEKTFQYKFSSKDSVTTLVTVIGKGNAGFISNLWNIIHKWKLRKHIHQNLDNLKVLINDRFKHHTYNGYQIKEVSMNQKYYITLRSEVAFENIQRYYSQNISALYQKALENNLTISGMPCGLYYTWDVEANKSDMAAALPTLSEINIAGTEPLSIPARTALVIEYHGDNSKTANAHYAMDDYMLDRNYRNDPPVIEENVTDPTKESDPEKWITNIIYYFSAKGI